MDNSFSSNNGLSDLPKSHVYVWGQSGNCQLGIEPNADGYETGPTRLTPLDSHVVEDVALGSRHSLILTATGLLSVGCNDRGQLGRSTSDGLPGVVDGLPVSRIVSISVGESHSLALTEDGVLYSWGDNDCGQLGRIHTDHGVPSAVQFASPTPIVQAVCGEYHCVALAKDGAVYTWGSNLYGQLGIGLSAKNESTPKLVQSIKSLHFVKISSGASHSFALTISGALFGWGRNSNGQLGLGNTEDHPFPVCCRALRQQRVKHVSCGLSHTAALTKDGGVFTFGAGNNGQLGHDISQDECLPKKILELMGSTVTQISCGRFHTLTLVPSSGRLYSFGLGAFGQLGISEETNKKTLPCNIRGPWSNGITTAESSACQYCIRRIAAGGNSSLAYIESKNLLSPSIDQRNVFSRPIELNEQLINQIVRAMTSSSVSSHTSNGISPKLEIMIRMAFCNPSVWNGAFLSVTDEEHGCSSNDHGLDLDKAKEQLSRLTQNSNTVAMQLLTSCAELHLMPALRGLIPDVEALRVFFILPFLPMFNDPANYSTIHSPYSAALISIDEKAWNVIGKWLLRIPNRHFRYYLFAHKNVVRHILQMSPASTEHEALTRQSSTHISLELMQRLYKINELEDKEQKVSCVDFYISEIAERVDIRKDYINWFTKSQVSSQGQPLLSFCNYAFVFDALAKTMLLHTDAVIQMQQAIESAHRLNLINILSSSEIDPVHPCLVITVSRHNLVKDTLVSLNMQGSADLKKPLKVQFKNEEAVDEGGVRKEFFLLILREVLDLKYGMFHHYDESRLLWFNGTTFEEDMPMFHLIGLLCGLAIYNITIIDLPFPLALYKKLLGKSVNLDDLRELDPLLGKSLQDLLDYDGDDVADVFCLTFSISVKVFDQVISKDLIPNGSNIHVTNDNRQEYVNSYVSYMFNESVGGMFQQFSDGFHKVCGSRVLSFFHPLELQSMVVGNEEYDWAELEKNCEYKGEFFRNHKTIDMFWQVFNDLTHEQKKMFLRFLTGNDRIPIQGMKSLKMAIQPIQISEEYLPAAHTCFNLLDLPANYSSKEKMYIKLLGAIENAEGFGLV